MEPSSESVDRPSAAPRGPRRLLRELDPRRLPPARRPGWLRRLFVGVFLAFLTGGLFLFDRGLYHDDILGFLSALRVELLPWYQRLHPIGEGPTRLLSLASYSLAIETSAPMRVLQSMLLVTWTATAFLAGELARRLRPRSTGIGTCTLVLVATASSDFLTGSLVGLGYQIAITAFLAAFVAAATYVQRGRIWALVISIALLELSLWTIDVAALSYPLVPLILAGTRDRSVRHRAFVLAGVWLVSTLPYVIAFSRFLRGSYAAIAIGRPDRPVAVIADQLAHNFLPWQWGPERKPWGEPPPALFSTSTIVAIASLATAIALWAWWRERGRPLTPATAAPLGGVTVAGVVALLAIANVPVSFVQMSAINFRTHLLSRIWASLLIALIAEALVRRRWTLVRAVAVALVGTFVFYGTWGGLERQSYFASAWISHRRELASILAAVPRLEEGSELVLVVPPRAPYMATEVPYLARVWVALLFDRPHFGNTTLVSPKQATGCRAESEGLRCWQLPCVSQEPCSGRLLPYEDLTILEFDHDRGVFEPADSMPELILDSERAPDSWGSPRTPRPSFRPTRRSRRLLVSPESTPWARYLFQLEERGAARWSPAGASTGRRTGWWPGEDATPVPMDYDGDGREELTLYSNGAWQFFNDDGSYNKAIWVGNTPGNVPVPFDRNGDGREDVVLFNGGVWHFFDFSTSSYQGGIITQRPGGGAYVDPRPAPLDLDGDGDLELGVHEVVGGVGRWHFFQNDGTFIATIETGPDDDQPTSRRLLP